MKTYITSGRQGDAVFQISLLKRPFHIYLKPNTWEHPYKCNGPCPVIRMTYEQCESLATLFNTQKGITASVWNGEKGVNLDKTRQRPVFTNKKWIEVEPSDKFAGKFIVNRTPRYRNGNSNFTSLGKRKDCVFVGYPDDYAAFGIEMPFYTAKDALELAQWIGGCQGVICGQSLIYILSESMGIPRIVEVHNIYPVVPSQPHGYILHKDIKLSQFISKYSNIRFS